MANFKELKAFKKIKRLIPTTFGGAIIALASLQSVSAESLTVSAAGASYDACFKQAFLDGFEEKTGISTSVGSPYYDMGVWKIQQETGNYEWDVSIADASQIMELIDLGWLEPIPSSILEGRVPVDYPDVVIQKNGSVYGIPNEIFGNVIVYNTEHFGDNFPSSWSDVFDLIKFPGKRLFSKSVADFGILEIALLADGVSPDELYPLDVDRAFQKLDSIKHEILWYESGAQQIALLQQGDAVIGAGWDGRIKLLQQEGVPVAFSGHQAIMRPDYITIPKGSNEEIAHRFLEYYIHPENIASWSNCIGYVPGWVDVFPLLDEEQKFTVASADGFGDVIKWNQKYWSANARDITNRFNEWLSR